MKLGGNILILTHWSYKDALIQTYTLPYVEIIRKIVPAEVKIVVITAEQERVALQLSEVDIINAEWGKENMQLIAQPYKRFGWRKIFAGIAQLIALYKVTRRNKVAVIHAFCTPAGGIGYIISKLTGKQLVIDSYEPHAESMVETGSWKKTGLAFKILFWLEKKLSERAIHIIATTVGMKAYAKEKYNVDLKSFFVKPACIDFEEFYPREKDEVLLKKLQLNEKIVCVYAGKLGGTYLRDELFDFVKGCYDYWGDRFRFLMLTSTPRPEIQQQIKRVGLPENIVTSRFVKHSEIPRYLSLGDFGINPQVPVPSKRFGSPIKNFWTSYLMKSKKKSGQDPNGEEVGWMVVCKIVPFPKRTNFDPLSLSSFPRWSCSGIYIRKFFTNNE